MGIKPFSAVLAAAFCLPRFASAEEGPVAVTINYFSNSQSIQGNLVPDAEFIKYSSAALESTEIVPTYRSGGAYVIDAPADISPGELKALNTGFTRIAEVEVLENPTTVLLSWPPGHDRLTRSLYEALSARPGIKLAFSSGSLGKAYILQARLPDGRQVTAVSDRETAPAGDWFKLILVNTRLRTADGPVVMKSLAKMFGGSGVLSDMAGRGFMEGADLNIALKWLNLFHSLPADAMLRLWDQTGTDIYAFTPYDLAGLNAAVVKAGKERASLPELISSNMASTPAALGGYGKRYAVRDIRGVRFGLFFVMDDKTMPMVMGPVPAELSDPAASARETVKALLDEEKVDVVVMLAMFFPEDLQAALADIPGVDIVINAVGADSFSIVRTALLKLGNWGDEKLVRPAAVADLPRSGIGKLRLEFARQNGKMRLISVLQDSAGVDPSSRRRNDYDQYDESSPLFGITTGAGLLPEPGELWSKEKNQYAPLEISNLGAMLLREAAGSEVSFVRITPFNLSIVGGAPESVLRSWLQHKKVITAEIDGTSLRALLKQADFDPVPVPSGYDREKHAKGAWLAAAGASKDGSVGGIPVSNGEIYTISFTEDLLVETKSFPALGRIKKKSDTGLFLDDLAVARLAKMGPGAAHHVRLRELMAGVVPPRWKWRFNVRDADLQFSETRVANTGVMSQVPNSKLQASDQIYLRGSLRTSLEARRETFSHDTRLSLDYGKTILRSEGGNKIRSENADSVLLENELRYAMFRLDGPGGAVLGPLVSIGYNTEFTRDAVVPRRRIALGKAGLKLFEGSVIRDFYAVAVMERDFTFPSVYTKLAWETGMRLGGLLAGGPEYVVDVSYKYFSSNRLRTTDLKREFGFVAKLKLRLVSDLNFAPFADYFSARGVSSGGTAHNFTFGLSLNYSRLFKIRG